MGLAAIRRKLTIKFPDGCLETHPVKFEHQEGKEAAGWPMDSHNPI